MQAAIARFGLDFDIKGDDSSIFTCLYTDYSSLMGGHYAAADFT
ncbi:MAG: hypothetical protein ACI8XX_000994 [Polaribacter sp.]|jgi:hypothetical protein